MALRSNLTRKAESRRHARHSINGLMRIMWEDDGQERMANKQIVDVSIWGVRLRVIAKPPVHSFVTCNDRTLGICGRARSATAIWCTERSPLQAAGSMAAFGRAYTNSESHCQPRQAFQSPTRYLIQ